MEKIMFYKLKDELLIYLFEELTSRITEKKFSNYENFGKEFEPEISSAIKIFLEDRKIMFEVKEAPNKNYFPDLILTIDDIDYAIDYKCGLYKKFGLPSLEPANDLGTITSYPKKIEQFKNNIICIFIKYSIQKIDNTNVVTLDSIYIDHLYKFVGRRLVGHKQMTKYREKDGNLRPKKWKDFDDNISYFDSLEEFQNALSSAENYRNQQLFFKILPKLSKIDLIESKSKISLLLARHTKKYK
jgi:hypothetical protein